MNYGLFENYIKWVNLLNFSVEYPYNENYRLNIKNISIVKSIVRTLYNIEVYYLRNCKFTFRSWNINVIRKLFLKVYLLSKILVVEKLGVIVPITRRSLNGKEKLTI